MHKVKIQDGGGRHVEFRKNVNNFGLDKDILHQIFNFLLPLVVNKDVQMFKLYAKMHHGDAEMTTRPKLETGS